MNVLSEVKSVLKLVGGFLFKHKKIVIPISILLLIFYVVFVADTLMFMPVRNVPDKMVVCNYGETIELNKGDKEFKKIYKMLRNYSKMTLFEAYKNDAISSSFKLSFEGSITEYLSEGLALRVIYNEDQLANYDEPYNELIFSLKAKGRSVDNYVVRYEQTEDLDKFSAFFSVIVRFPYPYKVEDYVRENFCS